VIVGGPLSATGEVILGPVRRSIARYALPIAADHVTVVPGDLGERATALGAVALVQREAGPDLLDERIEGWADDRVDGRRSAAVAVGS
jgi:hypothetical protein